MVFNRFAVAGLTAALTALVAGSAAAGTAPQYMTAVQGMQEGPDVPSSYLDDSGGFQDHSVSSGVSKTNFSAGAVASSANGGTVRTSIDLAPLDVYSAPDHAVTAESEAVIVYSFTIVPKNGSTSYEDLNVHVQASGAISWTNGATPRALFQVTSSVNNSYMVYDYITSNTHGSNTYIEGSDSFSTDETIDLASNELYYVQIAANTQADARSFDSDTYGEASASVDPIFTLVGPDAGDYTFVGAPAEAIGATPTAGVPEPASWALLISGFGLAGASLRRRRALPLA